MANVVIVGAGPAGASLAYLLARRGIEVTLLEREQGFSREFRGEVLMPSGLEALEQMGLQDAMEGVPSQEQGSVSLYMNGSLIFDQALYGKRFERHLPRAVSQPKLLEMLVSEAAKNQGFRMEQGASVKGLIEEDGRVVGVRARTRQGEERIRADLVVGADGRASIVRKKGGFRVKHSSPPLDVIWLKLPCPTNWTGGRLYMGRGHFLLGYRTWDGFLQLAWIIVKGAFHQLKEEGVDQWIDEMKTHVSPDLASHLEAERGSIHKPFLLDAVSDCVESWSVPGALLLGDAAHTMSPVGAQGINLALRDVIVAANHLVPALERGDPELLGSAFLEIERERMREIRTVQRFQELPPRVGFSHAWWGEAARFTAAQLARFTPVRLIAGKRLAIFPFGVTEVDLRV